MSDKPINHARDHRPGGTDPIGIQTAAWAALYIDPTVPETLTVPGGIIGPADQALLHSATSDSDGVVFAFESLTFIQLLQPGIYIAEVGLQWSDPSTSQGVVQVGDSLAAPNPLYGGTVALTANQTLLTGTVASKDSSLYFFSPSDVAAGNKVSLTVDLTAATAKVATSAYLRVAWIPSYTSL